MITSKSSQPRAFPSSIDIGKNSGCRSGARRASSGLGGRTPSNRPDVIGRAGMETEETTSFPPRSLLLRLPHQRLHPLGRQDHAAVLLEVVVPLPEADRVAA